MKYLIAIFFSPALVLKCGKPTQALIGIALCLLFWIDLQPLARAGTPASAEKAKPVASAPTFATADEAKSEAIRRYPDLAVTGSVLNREFVARYNRYKQERPSFFDDTSWPIRLVEEASNSVGGSSGNSYFGATKSGDGLGEFYEGTKTQMRYLVVQRFDLRNFLVRRMRDSSPKSAAGPILWLKMHHDHDVMDKHVFSKIAAAPTGGTREYASGDGIKHVVGELEQIDKPALAEENSKPGNSTQPPIETRPAGTPASIGHTTVGGYLASPSQEMLEKAISYAVDKDEAALNKIVASGSVIWLKGGLDVQIVDTKIFSGLVKIRPRGKTIELWTLSKAIK